MTEPTYTEQLLHNFIDMLNATGNLKSKAIERALRSTPRHLFVDRMHPLDKGKRFIEVDPKGPTKSQLERIYSDEALVSHRNPPSSTSQPGLVVHMLETLNARAGHRVLEVGAGTGWNAALLAHLVGPGGHVVTMDIQADVTGKARRHLKRQGVENVRVITGDAARGYAKGAPYDRLITTVTCPALFPAWWEQLALGGVMVLTLSDLPGEGSCLMVRLKKRKDHLSGEVVSLPGFMLFTGEHGITPQWDQAQKLVGEFARKRPTIKERTFWASIPGGMKNFARRDLVFFAQLQGFAVTPMRDAFVLTTHKGSGICVADEHHLTAHGGSECFDRFKKVQAKWLTLGAPSRQQYRVEVWPDTTRRRHGRNSWGLRIGGMEFIFSLK
jgi:protein-L-isoaspartate(D-aspartate) O-methyltransferase